MQYTTMTMPRDYTLRSLCGWTGTFEANTPKPVHPYAVKEAMEAGAIFAKDEDNPLAKPEEPKPKPPIDADRAVQIEMAFMTLVEKGLREDFTGTGQPRAASVTREAGFDVNATEIRELWATRATKE